MAFTTVGLRVSPLYKEQFKGLRDGARALYPKLTLQLFLRYVMGLSHQTHRTGVSSELSSISFQSHFDELLGKQGSRQRARNEVDRLLRPGR